MQLQFLLLLVLCAGSSIGVPRPSPEELLGVLLQETPEDLGRHTNMVNAAIDVLPVIAEAFEENADTVGRGQDMLNVERIGSFITKMMPASRRLVKLQAEEEGRDVDIDQIRALNAAEVVLPSVWNFMERLRNMQLFDRLLTFG
ncbi:hypothetical protein SK128_013399 [Halocaridina rubra]|uniref:Uncharacterized protein n=1 Tax=Halocaridina rubra TaxID=373956 RepID=A0AAN9A2Y5_HALRR